MKVKPLVFLTVALLAAAVAWADGLVQLRAPVEGGRRTRQLAHVLGQLPQLPL